MTGVSSDVVARVGLAISVAAVVALLVVVGVRRLQLVGCRDRLVMELVVDGGYSVPAALEAASLLAEDLC